jgi:hypothetical protein
VGVYPRPRPEPEVGWPRECSRGWGYSREGARFVSLGVWLPPVLESRLTTTSVLVLGDFSLEDQPCLQFVFLAGKSYRSLDEDHAYEVPAVSTSNLALI